MELTLQPNPLSRKNLYRLSVIKRLPQLAVLDSTEVSYDERQRTEIQIPESKPTGMLHLMQAAAPKVAVKLTSVNFDTVIQGEAKRRPESMQGLSGVLGVTQLGYAKKRK